VTFAVPAEGECVAAAIAVEQDYVNLLYRHLAEPRQHTVARLGRPEDARAESEACSYAVVGGPSGQLTLETELWETW
jgi:hypothetical protein